MTDHVIDAPPRPVLPVAGTHKTFPVRRVYCVGRNYAAHAIEMGHDPDREPPFFFLKPADALDATGTFPYPPASTEVHHEVELAVALGSGGADIAVDRALRRVYGYAVALDMTRRDRQAEAKAAGRPWEIGKAFDRAAPCGPLHPAETLGHPAAGRIELSINGQLRQEGDLDQMIWKVPELIAVLSRHFTLAAGDVILTGTPSGVGPVSRGDRIAAKIAGIGELHVQVT
ncbi:FAA hydrolase family protein [Rhodobacteraceae bacterium 2CG4]|uniref:FAA hydrolase family protein n=1 Tax=Halovulum marinum TaxID=2662447 RepID=A0A6L5YXB1_9RHOB|nr:fumarylacetoacetate hydrolase family protein [Halovulum marinum]MSU88877.1 FAA hydrolase family protein [Halovulum marinum]